ncbi:MAG TPA: histidine kinase [Niabella sp.]|nr:histidine kinase [Niabella sp.]
MSFLKGYIWVLVFIIAGLPAYCQKVPADSWKDVSSRKTGTITVLWNEIEPFIYRDENGNLIGVEYELMEGFKSYLKTYYNINLQINWKELEKFDQIYPQIRNTRLPGLFAVSYYSITDERKDEVRFSPPYMPDLNVLVTHNSVPLFTAAAQFKKQLASMRGFTQPGTTMEMDINKIRQQYYPKLPVTYDRKDDYAILEQVAKNASSFAYVPVSIYVVALQKGMKVKRQRLFDVHREGFAAIYPQSSDWTAPVDQYFHSFECKTLVASSIRKYLGEEVAPIILEVSVPSGTGEQPDDIELLTKEREIVTQRLMNQAAELEKQKSLRNMILLLLACLIIVATLLYGRFHIKHKLNQKLEQRNQLISKQNAQIDNMNQMLKLKVLQARMNPHFLFNSLNSIQYFIVQNDKKISLQYIARFSGFLRKLIKYGDELMISAADETALLKEYLWLEQTRFPGRFEYIIEAGEDSQALKILPLLTHGLVEKALYGSILNLEPASKGMLSISFLSNGDSLSVTIKNNGISRSDAEKLRHKKGLDEADPEEMLKKRIHLYNRQRKNKITVQFSEEDNINITRMEIPQPLF